MPECNPKIDWDGSPRDRINRGTDGFGVIAGFHVLTSATHLNLSYYHHEGEAPALHEVAELCQKIADLIHEGLD